MTPLQSASVPGLNHWTTWAVAGALPTPIKQPCTTLSVSVLTAAARQASGHLLPLQHPDHHLHPPGGLHGDGGGQGIVGEQ